MVTPRVVMVMSRVVIRIVMLRVVRVISCMMYTIFIYSEGLVTALERVLTFEFTFRYSFRVGNCIDTL